VPAAAEGMSISKTLILPRNITQKKVPSETPKGGVLGKTIPKDENYNQAKSLHYPKVVPEKLSTGGNLERPILYLYPVSTNCQEYFL